ncbi:anti-sigma factor [Mangrovibacillus cuniculi]|uniref:Anti-sigma-W factor RsiW n=1 Tax=Mangrovibacillus cuniculi TaxID=2593652 RepID=A0A7S8CEF6_9BACI|nr:anti-sigma factor [Mangrovibacillus cuniculi]QPC48482.1 anti-sigma factor [Mangrovibacillus cuniculi]
MSSHCHQVIDFVNNQLTEKEQQAFEHHLASCSECKKEVEELQALMQDLPFAATPIEPPADLKERVLAKVLEDDQPMVSEKVVPMLRKKNWYTPALAAALFLSVIANMYLISTNTDGEGQPTVIQSASLAPSDNSYQAFASIIGTEGGGQNLVIQASQLDELSGDEVYQVWLINEEGPIPTGSFTPDVSGNGTIVYNLSKDLQKVDWDQVAISIEPNPNSETPLGEVVLAGNL